MITANATDGSLILNGLGWSFKDCDKQRLKERVIHGVGCCFQDLGKSSGKSPVQKGMKSPAPSRSVPNLQLLGHGAQPSPAGPVQLPGAANPFWWHSRLYPDAPSSSVAGQPAMSST